ncbi:Ubiquitin-like protein ATG12 [Ceratocystis fimbriata CBS 114723]|uniref:Ubiquitin-like protein ATG12 n=1 Tax=Ceratocystis fimbriata CBS 114723 TaxID=1035309 RepID=A0A2C5XBI3_9PEZI|nr:Ubiquitin-like protein ATG12 [Ceratocystis fimbriata CBS 114723]
MPPTNIPSASLPTNAVAASSPAGIASPLASASTSDEDEDSGEGIPLSMSASTFLTHLPPDATEALQAAGRFPQDKVVVRFKSVGAAPAPRHEVCKISATQNFEAVVVFLRRMLKVQQSDSLFLYVNSAFAPSLDEVVGNLHRCFKNGQDQLVVAYSVTPAFG